MSLKKEMTRDEHGYINGRGVSKYWGVTVSTSNGRKNWVVSHHPAWSSVTLGHRANGFNLKEVDAARIAAFLFEQSMYADKAPEPEYVRSADGKYLFAVDPRWSLITRIKNTGTREFYAYKPNLLLPLEDIASMLSEPTKSSTDVAEEENKQILLMLSSLEDQPSAVMGDRELINLVTEAVLSKSITQTGARILIGVLEQVA